MYHQVGHFERPDAHRAGYCHVRRFRAQMRFFKRFGYHVLSLEQAYAGLFGGQALPGRSVVLTFDDGYRNFYEHALPVLREHGFPATVFVISDLIGERAEWLRETGAEPSPMMDAAMLREIEGHGVTIGSHTCSHARLSRMPVEQASREIGDSKRALEDLTGHEIRHFCYPYGLYNEAARDAVGEAGYVTGLTCIRGDANEADNPLEIPRKGISYGDSLAGVFWKVQMKRRKKLVDHT